MKGKFDCQGCGEPEDWAYAHRRSRVVERPPAPAPPVVEEAILCRRCVLPGRAQAAWDTMRDAERAVLAGAPGSIGALRSARVAFTEAKRVPAGRRRAR